MFGIMKPRPKYQFEGVRFGSWTVSHYVPYKGWECHCDCGTKLTMRANQLVRGISKSCGCRRSEYTTLGKTKHGHSIGHKISREYNVWTHMKRRCLNPKARGYKYWGGRGISICSRWMDFANFFEDMGPCPPKLTLERKDNNGNYEPENCVWADRTTQSRNRRTALRFTIDGKTLSLKEWAIHSGIPYGTLYNRLTHNWPINSRFITR